MNILVSVFGDPVWTLPYEEVDRLKTIFPQHRFVDARDPDALASALPEADVALTTRIDRNLLPLAVHLRWIQSPAAGVGLMMNDRMRESPVVLTNARGLHVDPIAEHAIGVTIALARHLHVAIRNQAQGNWAKPAMASFTTLRGRRMGVVGFGAIGSAIASRAACLGMAISALTRSGRPVSAPGVDRAYSCTQLPELLAESDVVVICAPSTPETSGLIGRRELRLMKPTAFLVNVSRGRLVREAELAEELAAGTIAGAALDVFEREPLDVRSPLWQLPNVIVTPHTSAFSPEYWTAAVDLFAENLRRFEAGRPLLNVVDKVAGY
ncbi:MAG: D-2-hydroxyacid dehydrogenase [Vicinamibacterales bacterium]